MNDLRHIRLAAGPHLPLTLFTLLGQSAVGLIWINHLRGWIDPLVDAKPLQLLLPVVLMGLSLAASFFHLHYPWNAWRSLSNWRSPLSQEALSAALFMGALCWEAVGKTGWLSAFRLPILPTYLVDLCGLLLLFTMIRLYRLRTIPVWNRMATGFSFLAASLLIGGAIHMTMTGIVNVSDMMICVSGLIFRLLAWGKEPLSRLGGAIQNSPHRLPGWWIALASPAMTSTGLALLFISTGLVLSNPFFMTMGLLSIGTAELADRVRFYARHGHDRAVFPPVTPAVSSWRENLE